MHALELKIPPVILVALMAILMWALSEIAPIATFDTPFKIHIATVLGVLGGMTAILGVLEFRRANTTVDPRTPHQTTSFVRSGIYRVSRNPMYLGFLCVLAGWGVYLSNGVSLLLLPLFVLYMNRFQIIPEERFMQEKFGTEYSAYMRNVHRWI